MNKKGRVFNTWQLMIAGVILFGLMQTGLFDDFMKVGSTPEEASSEMVSEQSICAVNVVEMQIYHPEQKTLSPRHKIGISKVYVNGIYKGVYEDGKTLSVTPHDNVEIYYGESFPLTEAGEINMKSFSGYYHRFRVPCRGTFDTREMSIVKVQSTEVNFDFETPTYQSQPTDPMDFSTDLFDDGDLLSEDWI